MSATDANAPWTRAALLDRLSELGISSTTIDHEASFTVADSSGQADSLPGAHTKNLFVKDEDG